MLAKALLNDIPLSDYASKKGVKITTVRWTLGNIFSKTETHSQNELKSLAYKYSA